MGRKPSKNSHLPPRMRARRQRSGKIYYYYDTGQAPRREIPLGDDYPLAVKKWAELEIDARSEHEQICTFRHVAERYVREVIPTKARRTQRDNMIELEKLYQFFDDPPAPLADIRPIHVRQYLDWRKEAPVRANREKALFSHIWNKAREWGYTDLPNPCAGIKGFSERGRNIYVEDEVFQAVHNAADQPLRDAMDLAYLTGQRPADVLALQETDIRDGVLYLQQNKTGTKLRIAVTGELEKVLARIHQRKCGCSVRPLRILVTESCVPLTAAALRKRFDRAREKACSAKPELSKDIQAFQFRDLRAKAGTDKAETAGDIREAQKQLGHSSLVMTEHYVRNRKGDLTDPTK